MTVAVILGMLMQAASPSPGSDAALRNEAVTRCILRAAEEARGAGIEEQAVADFAARACDAERLALRAVTIEMMASHGMDRGRAETMFDANFERQVGSLVETGDWASNRD